MNKLILHNIRILDFTWVLAGPYATRLLGDFGAEVIKIQPLLSSESDDAFARGYYYIWNRNKLGITLNLDKPEGIELAKKLVAISDAVVENFTPRVMTNCGLDYESLKIIKPDIIMVSISTMGQQSDKSYYSGYAPTVHALSGLTGLMSLDGKPVGPGFSYSDHIAALYASISLLEALEHRSQTGEGKHIDLSAVELMNGLVRAKSRDKYIEDIYQCTDGKWLAVTIDTEDKWNKLKRALGVSAIDGLKDYINQHPLEEMTAVLRENGIAVGSVHNAEDLVNDTQLKSRGFFVKSKGEHFIDTSPIRMNKQKEHDYRQAPSPGQDNNYVYGKLLGLGIKELKTLKEKGVI
jgi:crotonobetainyl-CoA:carnitine CoA-transferase CaiB-like acyl-CoA transferase